MCVRSSGTPTYRPRRRPSPSHVSLALTHAASRRREAVSVRARRLLPSRPTPKPNPPRTFYTPTAAAMSKARAPAKAADGGSAPRRVIDMMKEATGASDEDVCLMLQLCDGDPNKATEALLASG